MSEPTRTFVAGSPAEQPEYATVEGLDRHSVETLRALEARAAAKTASDYVHVVWAYGLIWALFCGYGLWLWRRGRRLEADVAELARRLDASARG